MVKRIAILFCILLSANLVGCAGMDGAIVPVEQRSLQCIHEVNMSKDQIFDKSLEWMARTFVDSKAVIELKDKDNGKIIGKGITSFLRAGIASIPCRYTLIIDIKDGKYRTTYENFVGLWGEYHNNPMPLENKDFVDQVKAKLALTDNTLFEYLESSKSSDKW